MGTAIRNSSAAFVVAVTNFSSEYDVMAMIIFVYMLSIISMMIISGELGKDPKIKKQYNIQTKYYFKVNSLIFFGYS